MSTDFTTFTTEELKSAFKQAWDLQASSTCSSVISGAQSTQDAILAEIASR